VPYPLAGGAAYASLEKGASTWDGVRWAVSTMTTVGYGDEFPETTLGRILGMSLMLVGIGFIAVLTGAVAERSSLPASRRRKTKWSRVSSGSRLTFSRSYARSPSAYTRLNAASGRRLHPASSRAGSG